MSDPTLSPRLVVSGADRAIAFYREVFGAEVFERFADPAGNVVHAALRVRDAVFSLTEHNPGFQNVAPGEVGGTPVLLHLTVEDAYAMGERLVAAGAEEVFPIADQFYGKREGRLRDPFGHLWIISQPLEDLSDEEIQRRMNEMMG